MALSTQPVLDQPGPVDPAEEARKQALQNQLGGAGGAVPIPGQSAPVGGDAAATQAPAAPQAAPAAASADPFAAMGGGVQINGGWVPNNNPAAQQQQGASMVGSSSTSSSGMAVPATIQGAYQQALQNLLTGPSPQQAGQDVMSSPAVTGYNLARGKQEERDRAMLAERAAAGGFSGSGGFETGVLGMRQAAGADMAQFAGDQAQKSETGRRQELLTALALAQQMGDTKSEQDLRLTLANMQQNQFSDQLGFQVADREQYYNQLALQSLFGGA